MLSWGSEGSKSASASTGAIKPPSAFTTFINSAEGGDSFRKLYQQLKKIITHVQICKCVYVCFFCSLLFSVSSKFS